MKTAHVIGKMNKGGVEAIVFNYLSYVDLDDLEIDVLYGEDSVFAPPEYLLKRGIRFIKIPNYTSLPAYISTIKRLCKENGYDIVHSHMNTLSVFSLFAAKCAGVKHRICHNHSTTSKNETKKNILKIILRPLNKLFATDYAACSELAGRWMYSDKVFDRGKVTVIRNAIDSDKFRFSDKSRNEIRSEYGIEDRFVIGHVGRFATAKNHEFMFEIFSEVLKIEKDAVLLLVGDGDENEKIRIMSLADKNEVKDRIVFAGLVDDTEKYYSAMDVFILPSLYEGLPLAAVEAQSAGLTTLISDAVTKECKITEHVEFLSITSGVDVWVDRICGAVPHDRASDNDVVSASEFNIKKSAAELRRYYEKILSKD